MVNYMVLFLQRKIYIHRRALFKCVVKCLRFREKREIARLIFAFARGFTWFARGSLFYCVLLNAIAEKTSQFAIIRLSHLKSVLRYTFHQHNIIQITIFTNNTLQMFARGEAFEFINTYFPSSKKNSFRSLSFDCTKEHGPWYITHSDLSHSTALRNMVHGI